MAANGRGRPPSHGKIIYVPDHDDLAAHTDKLMPAGSEKDRARKLELMYAVADWVQKEIVRINRATKIVLPSTAKWRQPPRSVAPRRTGNSRKSA